MNKPHPFLYKQQRAVAVSRCSGLMPFLIICTVLFLLCGCASNPLESTEKSTIEQSKLYTEMGTAALVRGELPQAVEDLRKAVGVNSDNAVAHNHLGLAYYGLGKKDLAKQEAETAVKIDPNYSDAYINLGNYAVENRNLDEAKTLYRKALGNLEYKLRHRALTNLAQIELAQGNTQAARTLLHQSIQANPEYCLSHFLLGSIYQRDANAKRAAEEFKKSVNAICTGNPEGHFNLGLSYMQLKEYDKARASFSYVIDQFPDSVQAKKASGLIKDLP